MRFFMKILDVAFIYKKLNILRYVTFLHKKSLALRKNKNNLCYVFIYKNVGHFALGDFHGILKLSEGGGISISKKQFTLRCILSSKNNSLCITFLYNKKPVTLCHIFICKKRCTLRYDFISKIHSILLITNYKRTYDQSDQI